MMNESNTELIDVHWFAAQPIAIGVVLVYNLHAGFKCYIGYSATLGEEEGMDFIYKNGTKLNSRDGIHFWGRRMQTEWYIRNRGDREKGFLYDGKRYVNA